MCYNISANPNQITKISCQKSDNLLESYSPLLAKLFGSDWRLNLATDDRQGVFIYPNNGDAKMDDVINFRWTAIKEKAAWMIAQGYTVPIVAKELNVAERTIFRWRANPYFIQVAQELADGNDIRIRKIRKQPPSSSSVKFTRAEPSYLYLLRSQNGLIKIGISNNPKKRHQAINYMSPVEIELLYFSGCKNPRKIERLIHELFDCKRERYEWFNLSQDDIEHIYSILVNE